MRRAVVLAALVAPLAGADRVLDERFHHLRSGEAREWSEFPAAAQGRRLDVRFNARVNEREQTVQLRHRDLKQTWDVFLNDGKLLTLPQDENSAVSFVPLPAGALRDGGNVVSIVPAAGASDDVEIGDVRLLDRARHDVLTESQLKVRVTDRDGGGAIPARITIADPSGSLVTLGIASGGRLAVRPGVVYTATGEADVRLPAGRYTVYATRGFEWGMERTEVEVRPGQTVERSLSIRREVATPGYVAVDTHCHTWTYSRHGDATTAERMVTIAGEGIELAVATDHNVYVNYESAAREAGVRSLFTPVVGNEVTTPAMGHFNVFPVPEGAKAVNYRAPSAELLFNSIEAAALDSVIVLNHARDIHGAFRPFDPNHHVTLTGQTLIPWRPRFNAMEVINSGATRSDVMGLVHDWMGLLNGGRRVAPIGASDSHDVSRYILGQGRTYAKCADVDPGAIDVAAACRSMREGRVLVSYGLLTDLIVADRFTPGEIATLDGDIEVNVRVLGPAWTTARHVRLYANGVAIEEAELGRDGGDPQGAGVKFSKTWKIAKPKHDVHLVAVATGPGVTAPYWPCAKPYQPTSIEFTPYVLGVSGAVFVDADGSGAFDSARDYAHGIVARADQRPDAASRLLAEHDEAVAAQVAGMLWEANRNSFSTFTTEGVATAPAHVQRAFRAVCQAMEAAAVGK